MLEKSDIILKHPSPFSIESLLGGKTGEEGPCISVSPPALQSPFMFPLVSHSQVRPVAAPQHHSTNINPDLFSPQNFPFDLLARGLYQNMTGLIGKSPPELRCYLIICWDLSGYNNSMFGKCRQPRTAYTSLQLLEVRNHIWFYFLNLLHDCLYENYLFLYFIDNNLA